MTNEQILQTMQSMFEPIRQDISKIKEQLNSIDERLETLEENTTITRNATNTLLSWAEEAQVQVQIPLFKKAE